MGVGLLQSVAGLHGTKGCMRGNASCPPDDDWAETRASLLPSDLTLSMGAPPPRVSSWTGTATQFSGPQTLTGTMPSAPLTLPLANCGSWDFSVSTILGVNS